MRQMFDIQKATAIAIKLFWATKNSQLSKSTDRSNRGAVVGGKQLDGFLTLIRQACLEVGVPDRCIYDKNNYVPGFFRSSKDWDFMIITLSGKLIALIELKSQVGSYGNNFNNRAEEAIGTATDLWTAFREKQFSSCGAPWVGYLMLIGYDEKSTVPVRNYTNHFPVLPEFENASYIDRYRILCEKLIRERLYTHTCLIWTKDEYSFGGVSPEIAIENFIYSLQGYLTGRINEFND